MASKEDQRERALAILEEQFRSTPSLSSSPIVGWADAPANISCRIEEDAYDAWHQGLDPITSGFDSPSPGELRKLKREVEAYTLAVAPLADPNTDQLILAMASYRAEVVSAISEPDGIRTLSSMVRAALAVNGEHRSFQAACAR
ncbi:hypothetical protein [Micromonospora sp. NPDC023633]|uniref:hypothetical protein n=1 Tax=Micromonospora sp. NPDC023633 TaxID=3154320 RepID=UPI0033FBCDB3